MTCSAYVLTKFRAPLELRTFQLPVPGPGEILVRLAASGVCGSDLHMYLGEDPRTPLPIILGHEGVGWVEAMGSSQAVSYTHLDVYKRQTDPLRTVCKAGL